MKKIDIIKQACWKANPEIEKGDCREGYYHYCPNCDRKLIRPIRLADVLLAMDSEEINLSLAPDGCFYKETDYNTWNKVGEWNLLKDSLEDQSPETIDFLYELLSPALYQRRNQQKDELR